MAEWKPKSAVPLEDEKEEYRPKSAQALTEVQPHVRKKPSGPVGFARKAVEALPAVGGLVGSVAGAPTGPVGAAGLASVLGAGGEAFRQVLGHAVGLENLPQTSGEAIEQIGKAGTGQAALALGGSGIAKGVAGTGKLASQLALRATPQVAKTAIREGIVATQAGLDAAKAKIGEWGGVMARIAAKAGQRGVQYQPADVVTEVGKKLVGTFEGATNIPLLKRKLTSLSSNFLRSYPDLITPQTLLKIEQSADRAATKLYRAVGKGEPRASVGLAAQWHKEIADWARTQLRRLPDSIDHKGTAYTMTAAKKVTQEIIKAKDAVAKVISPGPRFAERAISRTPSTVIGGTIGASVGGLSGDSPGERSLRGIEGALMGAALANPAILSNLGLALNNPLLLSLLRYLPQGGNVALKTTETP